MSENPCIDCSENFRKRPRCKSLKCVQYFEHLKEMDALEEIVEREELQKKTL
jgi:hypothetical protein